MAELSLWLDSYDDIYSDFDARSLLKRRISEDFIHELELAYPRREDNTDVLVLQLPAIVRSGSDEKLIAERLNVYFNKEYGLCRQQVKRNTVKNILFFCISVLVMLTSILITFRSSDSQSGIALFRIVLEPAGWFFFWNSLEYFFYKRPMEAAKASFWYTVAGWKILFRSY